MRSVVAILAGFLTLIVLGLGIDFIMMSVFPAAFNADGATKNSTVLTTTVAFSILAHAIGAYVTAMVAKRAEIHHALSLGCTLLIIAVPVTITRWSHAPGWHHILLLATVLPATYVGGLLRARQTGNPG